MFYFQQTFAWSKLGSFVAFLISRCLIMSGSEERPARMLGREVGFEKKFSVQYLRDGVNEII